MDDATQVKQLKSSEHAGGIASSGKFQVSATIKRGLFKREAVPVKIYKFNALGCIIKTDEIFSVNKPAILTLAFIMEPMNLVITNIEANVISSQKDCSCFYYEMIFTERSQQQYQTKLRQLERLVKLNQNFLSSIRQKVS